MQVRITVYLEDRLGSAHDFAPSEAASLFVKNSLQHLGFLSNDSKLIWQPTSCLVWLGDYIDLVIHTISFLQLGFSVLYRLLIQFVLSILLVPLENWPSLSVSLLQWVLSLVIILVLSQIFSF